MLSSLTVTSVHLSMDNSMILSKQALQGGSVITETVLSLRYHNKDADTLSGPYASMKKSICQTRGKATTPSNRRPTKLRDMLVEFEVSFIITSM